MKEIKQTKWAKMSKDERQELIHRARLGEIDFRLSLGDINYIFMGGCVMSNNGHEIYTYPNGKRTKYGEEDGNY